MYVSLISLLKSSVLPVPVVVLILVVLVVHPFHTVVVDQGDFEFWIEVVTVILVVAVKVVMEATGHSMKHVSRHKSV